MNINIDNEYGLRSDERNVILVRIKESKTGKNAGEIYEENVTYHANVQGALKSYLRIKTNLSEATSIQELLDEVKETKKIIENVLGGI